MTDKKKIKAVWLDGETKAALHEYAWANRTNASAVARAAIQDIIDDASNVSVLSDVDGMPTANKHLSVKATDEWWEQGVASAQAAGHSFTGLVRRRIRKILAEEGFIA